MKTQYRVDAVVCSPEIAAIHDENGTVDRVDFGTSTSVDRFAWERASSSDLNWECATFSLFLEAVIGASSFTEPLCSAQRGCERATTYGHCDGDIH
jgi:hypothetical protein